METPKFITNGQKCRNPRDLMQLTFKERAVFWKEALILWGPTPGSNSK